MEKCSSLISVVIPVYNSQKTIRRCLDSILSQSYSNLEIIIIDDGSDDGSAEIIKEYTRHFLNIRFIQQKNKGSFAARNRGIKEARGEWIGFVDSDDWIEAEMYESLIEHAASDIKWIESGYYTHAKEMVEHYTMVPPGEHDVSEFSYNLIYDKQNNMPAISQAIWTKLIRRSLLLEVLDGINADERLSFGDDAFLVYTTALKTRKLLFSNGCYYHHENTDNSLCKRKNLNVFVEIYRFYELMLAEVEEYPPEWNLPGQVQAYLAHIINMGCFNNFGIRMISCFTFPGIERFNGKRIVIYGAGRVGQEYIHQLQEYPLIDVAQWVDTYKGGTRWYGYSINSISELADSTEVDYVLIAIAQKNKVEEVINILLTKGFAKKQIVWERPISGPPLRDIMFDKEFK